MTAVATANGADEIGNVPSLVDGFRSAFVGAAGVAVAGALLAAIWLRRPRAATATEEVPAGAVGEERWAA